MRINIKTCCQLALDSQNPTTRPTCSLEGPVGKCQVPQLLQTSNIASRLGNSLGFFLQRFSGFARNKVRIGRSTLSCAVRRSQGPVVKWYQDCHKSVPSWNPSRVSGKQAVCRCPLESRALPRLVHFLILAALPSLSLTPLAQDLALSPPLPLECQREALGPRWDSPKAESSSRFAGAASASYRWTDAAGSPAAQQALAKQSWERRWQSGAHPGWRLGHRLMVWSGGPSQAALGHDKVTLACIPALIQEP